MLNHKLPVFLLTCCVKNVKQTCFTVNNNLFSIGILNSWVIFINKTNKNINMIRVKSKYNTNSYWFWINCIVKALLPTPPAAIWTLIITVFVKCYYYDSPPTTTSLYSHIISLLSTIQTCKFNLLKCTLIIDNINYNNLKLI